MQFTVKKNEDFLDLKTEAGDSIVLFTQNAEPIVLTVNEEGKIQVLNEEIFVVPESANGR